MSFFDEMISAARGLFALIRGRRSAPDYFDLSLHGLAGSFIAFFIALAVNAYLPALLGMTPTDGTAPWQNAIVVLVLFLVQTGFAALVLRQIGRLDGLVPYLVADNWATFFITILSVALGLSGITGDFVLLMFGILVIIIEINIARLIFTLSALQIAAFIVAQMIGVMVGLMLIGLFLPVSAGVL